MRSDVVALYVDPRGPYPKLVEQWYDEARDARTYAGPWPVVAHPPCARWGRYWSGGPSAKVRRKLGDDAGCFLAALRAVDNWGGVIEHPEASKAFEAFGLGRPTPGWRESRFGWVAQVEQGHWGHRARKKTWLYFVGLSRPIEPISWAPSSQRARLDPGYHSAAERAAHRGENHRNGTRLSARQNLLTPIAFAEWLLELASKARVQKLEGER